MAAWKSLRLQCFYKFKPGITHRSFIFRPYHAVLLKTNTYCHRGTFLKSREGTNLSGKHCFSDKPDDPRTVSVVVSRGPFQWISNKMKLFMVNSYFDAEFDEETFLEGAKQAVITVSALVSERKFNQLQGLLTDEAIEDLKDEVSLLNNIESYRITMDDILQTNIHDIGFQYDKAEKDKKWLHVMVSYICQGERVEQKELANITFVRIPLPRITRYSFRKECTSGVEDDWIITKYHTNGAKMVIPEYLWRTYNADCIVNISINGKLKLIYVIL